MAPPRHVRFKLKRGLWIAIAILSGLALVAFVLATWELDRAMAYYFPDRATPTPAPIDGKRAYGYLQQICKIGPRPAGSAANARQREMVAKHFKATGGTVREQPFSGTDPRSGAKVAMANLIGSWHPERARRVLLGAHYDTRPFPDEERDPEKRTTPFIGANDGASGVALLMEIAHHLSDLNTPWGVDLALFDGEELGLRPGRRILPRLEGVRPPVCPGGRLGPVEGAVRRRDGARHGRRAQPEDQPGAVQPELRPAARPGRLVGRPPPEGPRLPRPGRPRGPG